MGVRVAVRGQGLQESASLQLEPFHLGSGDFSIRLCTSSNLSHVFQFSWELLLARSGLLVSLLIVINGRL